MITDDEITRRIRARVPTIAEAVVGPHTAMGELMLTLRDLRRSENPEYETLLGWTLELVEELSGSPPRSNARNVVLAGFFDNVHHLGDDCRRVLAQMGPRAASLITEYEERAGQLCAP
jgi:hypothetical protein